MLNELVEDKKVEEMNATQKQIERLKRDKNLLLLENKNLIDKIANYEKESIYLNKRNETLSALEKSIPQRIENYKSMNAPECIIKELELWQDMLSFERMSVFVKKEEEGLDEDVKNFKKKRI